MEKNKEISFQRQLLEVLKKKGVVEDKTKNKKNNVDVSTGSAVGVMMSTTTQDKLIKEEKKAIDDFMNNNIQEISETESNKQKVNASIIEVIFSENMAVIA